MVPGFDPWSRRFPGEGTGNPLQYSCLEKSPRTEEPGGLQSTGWQSRTQLSDSHTPGGPHLCFPVCGKIREPGLRDHPFDVHHLCSRPQVPSGLTVWGRWGRCGGRWPLAYCPSHHSSLPAVNSVWVLVTLCSPPTLCPPHVQGDHPPQTPQLSEKLDQHPQEKRGFLGGGWQDRAERPAGTWASERKDQPRPPSVMNPELDPRTEECHGVGVAGRSHVQTGELLLQEAPFTPGLRWRGLESATSVAAQGQRPEVPVLSRASLGHPEFFKSYIFVFCHQKWKCDGALARPWASEPRL